MNQIVVGVDGSTESWAAVDLAVEVAAGRGAKVTAVYAEHLPAAAVLGVGASLDDVVEHDAELVEQLTTELRSRSSATGVDSELMLIKGRAVDVLLDVAKDTSADMIVVGHAGHGGALSMLGSVAIGVVHRSDVTVCVARS
jgi:nucleotide-binding universal stress UspA family protein